MKIIDLKCPNCGSNLQTDGKSLRTTCEYCGTNFLVEDGINRYKLEDAEMTGYLLEKGKQRAIQEHNHNRATNKNAPSKKKRKTWLWVLGWIFIFPVPTTILLLRSKKIQKPLKIGLIILAWLIYILIILLTPTSNANKQSSSNTSNITAEESDSLQITAQDSSTESNSSSSVNSTSKYNNFHMEFLKSFEKESGYELSDIEEFDPVELSKKLANARRGSYGVTAYNGESLIQIINWGSRGMESWENSTIDFEYSTNDMDEMFDVITIVSKLMDPDITDEEIKELRNYIDEHGSANPFELGDKGVRGTLINRHRDNNTYELFIRFDFENLE